MTDWIMITKERWIPVTERLPETHDFVLVTTKQKTGQMIMRIGKYNGSEWSTGGASTNVIAWMPLPEPYEEGKDD